MVTTGVHRSDTELRKGFHDELTTSATGSRISPRR